MVGILEVIKCGMGVCVWNGRVAVSQSVDCDLAKQSIHMNDEVKRRDKEVQRERQRDILLQHLRPLLALQYTHA